MCVCVILHMCVFVCVRARAWAYVGVRLFVYTVIILDVSNVPACFPNFSAHISERSPSANASQMRATKVASVATQTTHHHSE